MKLHKIYQLLPLSIREQFRNLQEFLQRKDMIKFHSQFIKPKDLVFDIGANIGNYAKIYKSLGAKVVCLEPQPYCISKLKKRFENDKNITIVEKGVAEKISELELNLDSNNHATATFSQQFKEDGPFNDRTWEKKIKVSVTTLDELIKQYGLPSYCKIDVEGYEYSVLKGLSKPIKYISFEYFKSLLDLVEKCIKHLEELGKPMYNYCEYNRPTKFKLDTWTSDKNILIGNINNLKSASSGDIYVRFE